MKKYFFLILVFLTFRSYTGQITVKFFVGKGECPYEMSSDCTSWMRICSQMESNPEKSVVIFFRGEWTTLKTLLTRNTPERSQNIFTGQQNLSTCQFHEFMRAKEKDTALQPFTDQGPFAFLCALLDLMQTHNRAQYHDALQAIIIGSDNDNTLYEHIERLAISDKDDDWHNVE